MKATIFLILISITISLSQDRPSHALVSAETKKIANQYFKNYFGLEFDKNATLMHDDITFLDPTAKLVFAGKLHSGKENVLANFKQSYSSITEMNPIIIRSIYSAYTAVFELDLNWKFKVGKAGKIVSIDMPLILILTIKDGKIIQHRDYGDYSFFNKQYAEQMKN